MAEARATTPKEWALAVGGGLALCTGLVWWMRPAAEPLPGVELVGGELAETRAVVSAQPTIAPAPIAAPALILRGILARGQAGSAILEDSAGTQRLVRVGQPVAVGWRLARLDAASATLEAADGSAHVLQFESAGATADVAPLAVSGALKARPESLAATSTAYRLALLPIAGETEVTGWRVQTAETIPLFRLAGLQPGDTLLRINGQPLFSEEKILELPSEIAGANNVEVEFLRAGKKVTVRVSLIR